MGETRVSREKVLEVLNSVRPMLQADGGDCELVDIIQAEGVVKVKLTGACGGCPMSQLTLQMGIERTLKQQVPGVSRVVAVVGLPEVGGDEESCR